MARRGAVEPQLDDLGEHLAAAGAVEVAHDDPRLHPCGSARPGHEHDRPGGMPLLEPHEHPVRLGEPLRRRPDDVRHRARTELGHRVVLLPAACLDEPALDVVDDAQCRRHERPSRWSSSSAARGPQLPAA